jgi:peptidoglycan/LPS O-acetylase OafA/YrhL
MKELSISLENKIKTTTNLRPVGRGPGRIAELDGLRGIAILLVVSFHYINNQLVDSENRIGKYLAKATGFGWVGVDLFFVLSGFLIGSILIANKRKENYFKTFYIRRLVRIVPNYFLLLICFYIIWHLSWFAKNYFLTIHNDIPLWSYFAMVHNFYMAHFNSLGNDALSVTWSIGIEEQFYLIFPFLVFFVKDRWLPWLLGALIILSILVRAQFDHWIPRYVLLPARLDGLAMGFLIAYFNYHGHLSAYKDKLMKWLPVVLVTDILICGFFYWKYDDLGVVKHTLFSIVFSILIIIALIKPDGWYGSVLRNKALVWIGTISYSLYLFHYLILGIAHHINGQMNIGIHNPKDILISILAFICSILLSWAIYKKLEQPMVKLGKRFSY